MKLPNSMPLMISRTLLLLSIYILSIHSEVLEKSYQQGLLSFSEWDLNHDCIVTYDEFKSWVLDMLMAVIKFQALVAADKPDSKDFLESTYESLSRRVIEDLSRLSNQNANITTIIDGFFTRLLKKFEDKTNYDVKKIQTIFKFNSRLNLTFWYNI